MNRLQSKQLSLTVEVGTGKQYTVKRTTVPLIWKPKFEELKKIGKQKYTREATKIISHSYRQSHIVLVWLCVYVFTISGYNASFYFWSCRTEFQEEQRMSSMWRKTTKKTFYIDEPTKSKTIRTDHKKIGIKRILTREEKKNIEREWQRRQCR